MMKITNTVTGKREIFKAQRPQKVTLYVCGVTPYDAAHIGHGRCYTAFDLLYRLLLFLDFEVVYCRNFTDIDDKLLNRAHKELGDRLQYKKIADRFIKQYHEDMKALNCLSPKYEPRVTDHIPEIISFISGLIEAGHAYESDGDVYFDITSFSTYGKLSKHKLEDIFAGARVQINEKKKNVLDFALWKSEPEGECWQGPWGYGRPGWHIECSALAAKYLGKTIDIHAGGLDLVFPHHENEIAQSEALHKKTFANYWMHNGLVRVNEEKMSKSLGNFFTLQDVFKQFDPIVVRYYLLQHHYRGPMDFSFDDIKGFEKSYRRLVRVFEQCDVFMQIKKEELQQIILIQSMLACLKDDLNTSGMFGILFENLDKIQQDKKTLCAIKQFLQHVLGLTLEPLPEKMIKLTPEIEALIEERKKTRAEKNWARADEIRDKLRELGVDVQDKKS
ncbi:cysteine--tRNA ligase [Candidatus Dependentiae bacterium]|nr:cysteine--tRNA ligase [Candidatus Dependentiae bacterium]